MTIIIVTHQKEYLSIADIAYTIKDGKIEQLNNQDKSIIIG
jgi:ABC-type lipoprotein export system ATPase subunit